jgi:hypothetical protein
LPVISFHCSRTEEKIFVIDKSTAFLADGFKAAVYGLRQVILLHHSASPTKTKDGLPWTGNLKLNALIPRGTFLINN